MKSNTLCSSSMRLQEKKALLSLKVEGTFEKGNMLHSGNSEEKRRKQHPAQKGVRTAKAIRHTGTLFLSTNRDGVCVCRRHVLKEYPPHPPRVKQPAIDIGLNSGRSWVCCWVDYSSFISSSTPRVVAWLA